MGGDGTEQRKPAKRRWSRGQWRSLGLVFVAMMIYGQWGAHHVLDIEPPNDTDAQAVRGLIAFVVVWCLLEFLFFSLVPFGKRTWRRLAGSDTPNMSNMSD